MKDKTTGLPVKNATVFILNSLTSQVLVLRSDSNGFFKTPVEKDILFVAKAIKPDYFDDCINFRFTEADSMHCSSMPRDLLLQSYNLNQVFTLENIYYDLDKWEIKPDAVLDQLVGILNHNPINIELASHTDSRASDDYNLELSFKRAESAVRYITMNGINPSRITARGYGETMLVNHCSNGVPCTEAEHQANRRTEFKVTSLNSDTFRKKVFDASIFKTGDVVPVQMLEPDFFKGCLLTDIVPAKAVSAVKEEVQEVKTAFPQTAVTKAVAQPVTAENVAEGDSYFTVQIFAIMESTSRGALDFKGEGPVTHIQINGFTKYFKGKFTDYNKALAEKKRLQNKFPGAFIVAFKNGNVVPVNGLIKLLK